MGSVQRNVVFNVALSLSQVLFPLLVFPYVSRVLGPQPIGEIAFVDSITQWCILGAALGIPIYGVREIAKVKHDKPKRSVLFSELLVLHVGTTSVMTAALIVSFHTVAAFMPYQTLFWVGTGILFLSASLLEWFFQGMGMFPYITIRAVLVRLVTTIAIFWLVRGPDDVTWYYLLTFVGVALNVVFNGWYARRFVRFSLRGIRIARHLRPLFYLSSFALVTSVYTLLDTAILGILADKTAVGYYSTALRLVKLVITMLVAVSTVMVATLSFSINQGNRAESVTLLRKSFSLTVLMGVPFSVGLCLVAPNAISLFAGNGFEPAAVALRFLAPTILAVGLSNVFGMQVLNTTNNESLFLRAALVGMAVSLVGNFLLIPWLQATGSAVANVLTEVVVCVLLAMFALRKFPFQPRWVAVADAVLAVLPMLLLYGLLQYVSVSMWIETVVMVVVGGATYFLVQHFVWKNPLVRELVQSGLLLFARQTKVTDSHG